MIKKILIATNNQKKLREISSLFEPLDIEVTSLKQECIEMDVEETEETFEGNAVLKATTYFKESGLPTLADDSGLVVDALDGAPGVYSARYSGEGATDEKNYTKLLEELKGVPADKRSARYKTVFAFVFPGQEVKTFEGTMEGVIAEEPKGENGFGYDPVFFIPQYKKTAAQVTQEQKNEISHRREALEKFLKYLKSTDL